MYKIKSVLALLLLVLLSQPVMADSLKPSLSYTPMDGQIAKVEIRPGVGFDEAIESLKLRANQHNLKFVGVNQLYKEIEALTGKISKRIEIFNFCDGIVAQKMIEANPLMISFMPCRIAILEDQHGKRWIIAMMINSDMIRSMPAETQKDAKRIMEAMKDIMLAASTGDL